jgi:hypothetical protein
LARSVLDKRVIVAQTRAALGTGGAMELVRYDCSPRP